MLQWVLAASAVLNFVGLWWGLPSEWAPIELNPGLVLGAVEQHFSHGWFDAYPPFHFYVLMTAMSPVLLYARLAAIDIHGQAGHTMLVVAARLVSVIMAFGTLIVTALCGRRAFGGRTGVYAAALLALTPPFVYYGKFANVDVPYLFWFGLSLLCFLRMLDRTQARDYVLFAAFATAAVCTKDQAYGLYLLVPVAVVVRAWVENRRAQRPLALLRAVFNGPNAAATASAVVLFTLINNIQFNPGGFADHVRFITGHGSEDYRMFAPTLAGHLALAGLTARLIQVSFGWPSLVVCVAGVGIAVAGRSRRRVALWLAVPAIGYYFGFINVILYDYDRFILPIALILAIFGGLAVDVWLGPGTGRWRRLPVALVLLYSVLYAGTVDVLLLKDSRYTVEAWMASHASRSDLIGTSGLTDYLPRFDGYQTVNIQSLEDLAGARAPYIVLNADYVRAVPPDTTWGQMISALQRGSAGYTLVYRYRTSSPWPWLPGGHPDLVGRRHETLVASTLRNINPTIEVFRRRD